MTNVPRTVICPRCGAKVAWTPAATFRPFCSERCKLVDLGDWATERFRIESDSAEDSQEPEDRKD